MIKNFPPNTEPNLYAFTATIVGAITSNDFNNFELSSIGNWIILVGQYLVTVASQNQLLQSRKQNFNYFNNQKSNQNEIDYLLKAIKIIQEELEDIKKSI